MLKKRAKELFKWFFLLLASWQFAACEERQSKRTNAEPDQYVINQDSIDQVRKSIDAKRKEKELDKLFTKKARHRWFNGCVLVAQKGQIIYKDALGYSNFKTKEELKINSAFQLSSTSKPFTATAILMLAERGKLNLDDSVQRFIPEFPYQNITIKSLLTHRSGLSNYIYFGEDFCDKENCYNGKTFDNDCVLEIMKNNKPAPYSSPNRRFEYCNTNYALLASIVERASGEDFRTFMKENIFEPLNMKNTWVHTPNYKPVNIPITVGHTSFGRIERNEYADGVVGDKGIYSTIEDLFLFDQAMYTEKLLSSKTIEEAFTGYSNERRGTRNYGYGWRITEEKGAKIIYHNGWWHGYNSLFYRRIDDQTTVIILSNRDNKSVYKIEDVLEIITPAEKESIAELNKKK